MMRLLLPNTGLENTRARTHTRTRTHTHMRIRAYRHGHVVDMMDSLGGHPPTSCGQHLQLQPASPVTASISSYSQHLVYLSVGLVAPALPGLPGRGQADWRASGDGGVTTHRASQFNNHTHPLLPPLPAPVCLLVGAGERQADGGHRHRRQAGRQMDGQRQTRSHSQPGP